MTPIDLMKSLKRFLEQVIQHYSLETNVKTIKEPQVIEMFLPPKKYNEIPDYPFIIIRIIDGEDTETDATVKVKLLFGTYSEDRDGYADVLNMMERVRQELLKQRILDKKYRMELPYTWKVFEEQPYPEWIGEATTTWVVSRVQEEVPWLHE